MGEEMKQRKGTMNSGKKGDEVEGTKMEAIISLNAPILCSFAR